MFVGKRDLFVVYFVCGDCEICEFEKRKVRLWKKKKK